MKIDFSQLENLGFTECRVADVTFVSESKKHSPENIYLGGNRCGIIKSIVIHCKYKSCFAKISYQNENTIVEKFGNDLFVIKKYLPEFTFEKFFNSIKLITETR